MNEPINMAQQTEEVFGIILGLGVLLFIVGWCWPSITAFLSKLRVKSETCEECGKTLYPCKVCGCTYDDVGSAASCAEWDNIIDHNCHLHHEHSNTGDLRAEECWLIEHPEAWKPYSGKMMAVKIPEGIVAAGDSIFDVMKIMNDKKIPLSHTLFIRMTDDENI